MNESVIQWIKVTPETMPSDGERVLVTVEDESGKYVMTGVRYNQESHKFERLIHLGVTSDGGICNGFWDDVNGNVTYWAKLPAPAED